MPEEILFLFLFMFTMVTSIVLTGMVLGHRRKTKELQAGSRSGDGSLTTSELERLMRRAVDEGTEPLRQALEDLEARLADRGDAVHALPPADKRVRLDEEEEVISTSPIPSRTRTR
ncbi:MAG: hypothetical protein RIE53_03580 [Rhodothermales bacterium]